VIEHPQRVLMATGEPPPLDVTFDVEDGEEQGSPTRQCDQAPVRCVGTAELDLVGLGIRAPHRDADAILRGLERHS
jgi:hypothetical protein